MVTTSQLLERFPHSSLSRKKIFLHFFDQNCPKKSGELMRTKIRVKVVEILTVHFLSVCSSPEPSGQRDSQRRPRSAQCHLVAASSQVHGRQHDVRGRLHRGRQPHLAGSGTDLSNRQTLGPSGQALKDASRTCGVAALQVEVVRASSELILRGLQPGTVYRVRVRVKLDGISYSGYWSSWSQTVSVETLPAGQYAHGPTRDTPWDGPQFAVFNMDV